ncbi:hypothetical protein J6590_047431, partial [Homalodisca vitripennis]
SEVHTPVGQSTSYMDNLTRGERWRIAEEKRRKELVSIWDIIFYGVGGIFGVAICKF